MKPYATGVDDIAQLDWLGCVLTCVQAAGLIEGERQSWNWSVLYSETVDQVTWTTLPDHWAANEEMVVCTELVAECWASELDVFEGYGRINVGAPTDPVDDFYTGTLHRNSAEFYGQPNQSRFVQGRTGLDLSDWHVYAALWTDSTVSYYIDGELQGSVETFDSTRQPMHVLFYNWNTDWEPENMPNANTQDRLNVSVDWVRVWQQ